jgi:hypothetical protein
MPQRQGEIFTESEMRPKEELLEYHCDSGPGNFDTNILTQRKTVTVRIDGYYTAVRRFK